MVSVSKLDISRSDCSWFTVSFEFDAETDVEDTCLEEEVVELVETDEERTWLFWLRDEDEVELVELDDDAIWFCWASWSFDASSEHVDEAEAAEDEPEKLGEAELALIARFIWRFLLAFEFMPSNVGRDELFFDFRIELTNESDIDIDEVDCR